MKQRCMEGMLRLIIFFVLAHVYNQSLSQTESAKADMYIVSFNPVYTSGLLELGYVSSEDLYLIVSDEPLKIDSMMAALGRNSYSSISAMIDTMKLTVSIYKIVEHGNSKKLKKINNRLNDYTNYGRRFLFLFHDNIRLSSSLMGFVISRYITTAKIEYKPLKKNCEGLTEECKVWISNL